MVTTPRCSCWLRTITSSVPTVVLRCRHDARSKAHPDGTTSSTLCRVKLVLDENLRGLLPLLTFGRGEAVKP